MQSPSRVLADWISHMMVNAKCVHVRECVILGKAEEALRELVRVSSVSEV